MCWLVDAGHPRNERFDVVTHQEQLLCARRFSRVHGEYRRRQSQSQPPALDVNERETEDVTKEGTIGLGVAAVDDDVRSADTRITVNA